MGLFDLVTDAVASKINKQKVKTIDVSYDEIISLTKKVIESAELNELDAIESVVKRRIIPPCCNYKLDNGKYGIGTDYKSCLTSVGFLSEVAVMDFQTGLYSRYKALRFKKYKREATDLVRTAKANNVVQKFKYCICCGTKNGVSALFCENCGVNFTNPERTQKDNKDVSTANDNNLTANDEIIKEAGAGMSNACEYIAISKTTVAENDESALNNDCPVLPEKKETERMQGEPVIYSEDQSDNSCKENESTTSNKKSLSWIVAPIIAVVIVIGALLTMNIYQYKSNRNTISQLENRLQEKDSTIVSLENSLSEKSNELSMLEEENSSQKADIDILNATMSSLESKLEKKKTELSNVREQLNEARTELDEIYEEVDFYREHAGIFCDDGTDYYHVYGCEDLDLSSFYIGNTKLLESCDAQPCPKCH